MREEEESHGKGSCGCGCFMIVLEAIGFMLICNFIGCEWAKKGTRDLVNYAHELWSGASDNAMRQ